MRKYGMQNGHVWWHTLTKLIDHAKNVRSYSNIYILTIINYKYELYDNVTRPLLIGISFIFLKKDWERNCWCLNEIENGTFEWWERFCRFKNHCRVNNSVHKVQPVNYLRNERSGFSPFPKVTVVRGSPRTEQGKAFDTSIVWIRNDMTQCRKLLTTQTLSVGALTQQLFLHLCNVRNIALFEVKSETQVETLYFLFRSRRRQWKQLQIPCWVKFT